MDFREFINAKVAVFDGAMGTELAKLTPPPEAWLGKDRCNEALNLTVPDLVAEVHRQYLEAGADVVETNSFGGAVHTLKEYGLDDQCEEINRRAAEIARAEADRHAAPDRFRFVAGSIGPGSKLPSLGNIGFDELEAAYLPQVRGLVQGGVDLLAIETCQDPLQIKAALVAARSILDEMKRDLPILISVTLDPSGTMLVGTDPEALAAIVSPFGPIALGLNCGTGPATMLGPLKAIRRFWSGPISAMPNAGLPELREGRTVYPLDPDPFVAEMRRLALEAGLSIVGGCCGTTPAHIVALRREADTWTAPVLPAEEPPAALASLFSAVAMRQTPPPAVVGERLNANGSKQFRRIIESDGFDEAIAFAKKQAAAGAHLLDVCVAIPGRNETADMNTLVSRLALEVATPILIDSTDPGVVEAALRRHGGRLLVNSANLEKGEEHFLGLCRLAKRYGAALIVLTIDEEGMARDTARKLTVAERMHRLAVQAGLKARDLVLDPLTFTIGSGDASLRNAARETLEAIRTIKAAIPGSHTLLGVSNVSYGLAPHAREVLNAVFLHRAIAAGLDLAIVDASRMRPLSEIPEDERRLAEALVDNDTASGDPLQVFIEHFMKRAERIGAHESRKAKDPAERLRQCVIEGNASDLEMTIDELLWSLPARTVLNDVLLPAMRTVGEHFDRGEMPLPFVLRSAEVMRKASSYLGSKMGEEAGGPTGATLVLATVKGDVHDIGKDLVDLVLSNHGHRVLNLGTRIPISRVIDEAKKGSAHAIGLSGLLTSSALQMKEDLAEMHRQGERIPVLLGGAALNRRFVEQECRAVYPDAAVVYCPDPFRALEVLDRLAQGKPALDRENASPSTVSGFERPDPAQLWPLLDDRSLFAKRWGFYKRAMPDEVYDVFLTREVLPLFTEMKHLVMEENLIEPAFVCGFFECRREGTGLVITTEGGEVRLELPERPGAGGGSVADAYGDQANTQAVLQLVTLGSKVVEKGKALFRDNEYRKRFLLHGLAAELTEALAELASQAIRQKLGIPHNQGMRVSPGYPAFPDLRANHAIARLLGADRIGVTVEPGGLLVPEYSTSALFVPYADLKTPASV